MPFPLVPRAVRNTIVCLAATAGLLIPVAGAGAQGPADGPGAAADDRHGRSTLDLQLVSRTLDVASGSWTLVVEGRLDSRALCLPILFDCIIEPQAVDGATLADVECLSPRWNHLLFFTDRCIKQALVAGHDQQFQFTYVTDPGTSPASIDLDVRFGRGVLPVVVRELTAASLGIDLTASADVVKQCPDVTVRAGEEFECLITVTSPDPGDSPPPIDVAVLADTGEPGDLVGSESLVGPAGWTCDAATCTLDGATIEPGDRLEFTYRATAATTQDGGTFENTATLDYGVGSATAGASSSDQVVVVGQLDTELVVEKFAETTSARPGEPVSWIVSVTNEGGPANDVVLTDLVTGPVEQLTVRHLDGAGTWQCTDAQCATPSMPIGVANFRVTGTLATTAEPGTVVNQVDVVWSNDVFGPDHPEVAGAGIEVLAASVVPVPRPPTANVPSSLAFTG